MVLEVEKKQSDVYLTLQASHDVDKVAGHKALTRALMGVWIFHHLMGVCVFEPPPHLSRLLRIVE